jgi:hypothetical protein
VCTNSDVGFTGCLVAARCAAKLAQGTLNKNCPPLPGAISEELYPTNFHQLSSIFVTESIRAGSPQGFDDVWILHFALTTSDMLMSCHKLPSSNLDITFMHFALETSIWHTQPPPPLMSLIPSDLLC